MKEPCICQSGKSFRQCCYPYLHTKSHAKTAVQLMRSRYSAYALGGYGEYLLSTWKEPQSDMSASELSIRRLNWSGLEVLSKSQRGDAALVEFRASFLDNDGSTTVHHEESKFERIKGRWYYVNGIVNFEN